MPKFYHVLALDTLCYLAILGLAGYLLQSYALLLLAPFLAYHATVQTHRNLNASGAAYRRISRLFTRYREESLLGELFALEQELKRQQEALIITMTSSGKLHKSFKALEEKVILFVKDVRAAEKAARMHYEENRKQAEERARQYSKGHFEITRIAEIEEAVDEILNLDALKRPKFRYASPAKQKEIVMRFSKAFSVEQPQREHTLFNRVMGRLARQAKSQAA